MGKVPPTPASTRATQNPALSYQVQDEHGKVRTFFEIHPAGNRKQRRTRQRHYPSFTKTTHKGREWWQLKQAYITLNSRKQSGKEGTGGNR